jgi:hypothetical protein
MKRNAADYPAGAEWVVASPPASRTAAGDRNPDPAPIVGVRELGIDWMCRNTNHPRSERLSRAQPGTATKDPG